MTQFHGEYTTKKCQWCGGTGAEDRNHQEPLCRACSGTGSVLVIKPTKSCGFCHGTGRKGILWAEDYCPSCGGTGWANNPTQLQNRQQTRPSSHNQSDSRHGVLVGILFVVITLISLISWLSKTESPESNIITSSSETPCPSATSSSETQELDDPYADYSPETPPTGISYSSPDPYADIPATETLCPPTDPKTPKPTSSPWGPVKEECGSKPVSSGFQDFYPVILESDNMDVLNNIVETYCKDACFRKVGNNTCNGSIDGRVIIQIASFLDRDSALKFRDKLSTYPELEHVKIGEVIRFEP